MQPVLSTCAWYLIWVDTGIQVLTLLLNNCESEEECRNVVAECLGHLALLAPEQVLPSLQQQTSAQSSSMRTAVVTALKYTLVDQAHPVDSHLQAQLPAFLALLADPDRSCSLLLPHPASRRLYPQTVAPRMMLGEVECRTSCIGN